MNKVHRIIWNEALQMWMAVAENAKGHSKSSRSVASAKRRLSLAALVAGLATGSAGLQMAYAAPAGGQVTSGVGSIAQAGSTTTINQTSQNLSLNWKSFNVGTRETVNFVQPSATAIAVNRIFDTNGSQILGNLNANGQVFLINPNGVIFGAGAQVNVGGLVASTLDIASSSGSTTSFAGTGTGSVINLGKITAANGGYVALLGNQVSNQGVISAQLGKVALGAGSAVTLSFNASNLVRMVVDQSVLNTLAENGGLIQADGGQVLMTAGAAKSLLASVVNNTGVIEARTVNQQAGSITLLGGMQNGTVNVAGTLDASAPTALSGGQGGNGGFIETSAAHVAVADAAKITTAPGMGLAGTWLIDPTNFTISAGAGALTTSGIGASALGTSLGSGNVSIATSSTANGSDLGDINVNSAVSWSANKLTLTAHNNINVNANLNGSGTASLALEYGQSAVASGNTRTYNLNNGAQVNLPSGANFSTKLGSDGATKSYTVITSLGAAGSTTATDLQGISGGLSGNYVLGGNIDASTTSTWNAGAGFAPISSNTTTFAGTFDGLGHTISGLTIYLPGSNSVGLFGRTTGLIQNVGMVGGSVEGYWVVGGLVANNAGQISNSFTTGIVLGDRQVGGLVGNNSGQINNSFATGDVIPGTTSSLNYGSQFGGLVGGNSGQVTRSYATGNVYAALSAGGLVGGNTGGQVSNSYATGQVGASYYSGGLVGVNAGQISNSYATGSINGATYMVGGLVGKNIAGGTVSNSYATGSVSGGAYLGGLVGLNYGGTVSNSYWNTTTSGLSSSDGGTGLTSAQMMQAASFSGFSISNTSGSAGTWRIYEGQTAPLLTSFLTPLTLGNTSLTYNGTAQNGMSSIPAGVLGFTQTNAGVYSAYSNQQGYDISSGNVTIAKAALTVTGLSGTNRTYDGTTVDALSGTAALVGLVSGESLSVGNTASGTLSSANAGTQSVSTAITVADGTGLASNYTLAQPTGLSANITPAILTATVTAPSKTYDGTTTATPTLTITAGLVGTETVTATGTASFNSANVLEANLVTVNADTLANGTHGGLASNYSLAAGQTVAANITSVVLAAPPSQNHAIQGAVQAAVQLAFNAPIGPVASPLSTTVVSSAGVNSAPISDGSSGANTANNSNVSANVGGAAVVNAAQPAVAAGTSKQGFSANYDQLAIGGKSGVTVLYGGVKLP